MKLYHWTLVRNIKFIRKEGLLPLCSDEVTENINYCLYNYTNKMPIDRTKCIFFTKEPRSFYKSRKQPIFCNITVESSLLNQDKLFIANLSYADILYTIIKYGVNDLDAKETTEYAEKYATSIIPIKQYLNTPEYYEKEYKEIEFLYMDSVPYKLIKRLK